MGGAAEHSSERPGASPPVRTGGVCLWALGCEAAEQGQSQVLGTVAQWCLLAVMPAWAA